MATSEPRTSMNCEVHLVRQWLACKCAQLCGSKFQMLSNGYSKSRGLQTWTVLHFRPVAKVYSFGPALTSNFQSSASWAMRNHGSVRVTVAT